MKLHDVFDFIISINEMFNTKINIDSWKDNGNKRVGHIKINDADYYINLEPHDYNFNDKKINFINVSFDKLVNGTKTQELTYDNKSGSKVIGAIFNAILEEISKYEVDAIVFIALDNVEKRMRIYNSLIGKITNFLSYKENVKLPNNSSMTIIFNNKFPINSRNEFEEHLKNIEK